MTRLILSVAAILSAASVQVQASQEVLMGYIAPNETLSEVRNHHNLWQGYVHRNGSKSYFHALIEDNKVVHWYEKGRKTDMAEAGQLADVSTTVAGLAMGAAESNPLGLAVLPAKYVLNNYVEEMTYDQCKQGKAWLGAFGWGPAATNLVTLAAGSLNPAGLVIGALAGMWGYQEGAASGHCELWVGPVVYEEIQSPVMEPQMKPVSTETLAARENSINSLFSF